MVSTHVGAILQVIINIESIQIPDHKNPISFSPGFNLGLMQNLWSSDYKPSEQSTEVLTSVSISLLLRTSLQIPNHGKLFLLG